MHGRSILAIAGLAMAASGFAETRRAVLVMATPGPAAERDVAGMRDVLTSRFGVDDANCFLIRTVVGESLLADIRQRLVDTAKAGDAGLIYVSSRMNRGIGSAINAEFGRFFRLAREKGVFISLILDANHAIIDEASGESEAVPMMRSGNHSPADLTATDLGGPHGAWSWALLKALGAAESDVSIAALFDKARSILMARPNMGEPVLTGRGDSTARGLFGQPAGPAIFAGRMSVVAIDRGAGLAQLNAGRAIGLAPACMLKRVSPGPSLRLEVAATIGISGAEASVAEGGGINNVGANDVFELEQCAPAQ